MMKRIALSAFRNAGEGSSATATSSSAAVSRQGMEDGPTGLSARKDKDKASMPVRAQTTPAKGVPQQSLDLAKALLGEVAQGEVYEDDPYEMLQGYGDALGRLSRAARFGIGDDAPPKSMNSASLRALADAACSSPELAAANAATSAAARSLIGHLTQQPGRHLRGKFDPASPAQNLHDFEKALGRHLDPVKQMYPAEYTRATKRSVYGQLLQQQPARSEKAAEKVLSLNTERSPMPTSIQAKVLIEGNLAKPAFAALSNRQRRQLHEALLASLDKHSPATVQALGYKGRTHQWADRSPGMRFIEICGQAKVPPELQGALQQMQAELRADLAKILNEPAPGPASVSRLANASALRDGQGNQIPATELRKALASPDGGAVTAACAAVLAVAQRCRRPTQQGIAAAAQALLSREVLPEPLHDTRNGRALGELPTELMLQVYSHLDARKLHDMFLMKAHDPALMFAAVQHLAPGEKRRFFANAPGLAQRMVEHRTDAHLPPGQWAVTLADTPSQLLACADRAVASAELVAFARSDSTSINATRSPLPSMQTYADHALAWLDKAAAMAATDPEHAGQLAARAGDVMEALFKAHYAEGVKEARARAPGLGTRRRALLTHAMRHVGTDPNRAALLMFLADTAETKHAGSANRLAIVQLLQASLQSAQLRDHEAATAAAQFVAYFALRPGFAGDRAEVLDRICELQQQGLVDGSRAPAVIENVVWGLDLRHAWGDPTQCTKALDLAQKLLAGLPEGCQATAASTLDSLGTALVHGPREMQDEILDFGAAFVAKVTMPHEYLCRGIVKVAHATTRLDPELRGKAVQLLEQMVQRLGPQGMPRRGGGPGHARRWLFALGQHRDLDPALALRVNALVQAR